MITDKQFEDAFTAAGGWFLLTQYETIANWSGNKAELVDYMYQQGFDKKRSGSNTRVSSVIRIIDNGRSKEAILRVRDSVTINRQHPQAYELATELLNRIK